MEQSRLRRTAILPGWLFQLTGKGLALEVTVNGTKYYQDDKLN